MKAGKLSAARDANGVWLIEACEVERLYPLNASEEARPEASPAALPRDALADALVLELRQVIADLRTDRDAWRAQAERLALPKPEAATPPAGNRLARAWRWMRAAG